MFPSGAKISAKPKLRASFLSLVHSTLYLHEQNHMFFSEKNHFTHHFLHKYDEEYFFFFFLKPCLVKYLCVF